MLSASFFSFILATTTQTAVAGDYQYPFSEGTKDQYLEYGIQRGFGVWSSSWNGYHLADDLASPTGTKIYAIADGVVKESQDHPHGGYGDTCGAQGYIVLIESETEDGQMFTTVYGHVQDGTYDETSESGLVPEGTTVTKGQYIATIADYWADADEDGVCGDANWDHLHLGVRLGAYNSSLSMAGYGSSTVLANWVDPIEFIGEQNAIVAVDEAIDNSTTTSSERSSELAWLEDMEVLALNPYSGFTSNTTVGDMIGSELRSLHVWYGGDIEYDSDGVPTDAYVVDYNSDSDPDTTDEAIIVYDDGAYAVPIWGDIWDLYIEQLDTSVWTITSNCSVDWFSGGTAYGPSSLLGLPTTSEYYVNDNDRWRQDFQRGYVSKDDSTNTIYVNCFNAYQSTSEPGSPGWSEWDGWAGQLSTAVTEAWWRNGAKEMVGYPYDNGGGANLHIWGGVLIQDFTGEVNEDNAIIVNLYGLGQQYENDASVVRNGFWEYYKYYNGHLYFGAPLGDEMSLTEHDDQLRGYDPRCDVDATTASIDSDGFVDYEEREDCIYAYCGSSNSWTSMQRFEDVTLCWSGSYVDCDPKWENPYCPGSVIYSATGSTSSSSSNEVDTIMMIFEPDAGLWHWMTSDGSAFDGSHSEEATQWYANSNGSDCYDTFYQDVNGDDLPDLVFYEDVDGAWYVQLGDGTKDGFADNDSWITGHGESSDCSQYQGFLGDVDGDGLVDAITYETAIGEWYVAYNAGTSFDSSVDLVLQSWGNQTYDRFKIFVEDVTGDGVVEFVAHEHALGKWHAAENDTPGVKGTTYSGLSYLLEENWCKQTYSDQYVCELTDLDGDGAAEPVAYEPVDGDHHKAISNGVTFDSSSSYLVGDWLFGTSGQYVSYYIDVTFDGNIDVVMWEPDTGYWYVADGNGDGTANSSSTVWVQPAAVVTYEDQYILVPLK